MIGHDTPLQDFSLNDECDDLYVQCTKLIKYGVVLLNLFAISVKKGEIKKGKAIKKMKPMIKQLKVMDFKLKKIKEKYHIKGLNEVDQLCNIAALGDEYNNWITQYTIKLMPKLENIKNLLDKKVTSDV